MGHVAGGTITSLRRQRAAAWNIRKWRNLIVFSSGNRGLHMNGSVISSFSEMAGRLTAGWFHDENYEFKSWTEVSTV